MIRENRKIPPDAMERIPSLVAGISKDADVIALYAFGSLAAGRLKPLSDLDFGVLLSEKLNRRKRLEKHLDLLGMFNVHFGTDEVDLVLMNDAPVQFNYEILKTGKRLHCKYPVELVDFSEKMVKLYLDFRYFRDRFDEVFLEGIGYRG